MDYTFHLESVLLLYRHIMGFIFLVTLAYRIQLAQAVWVDLIVVVWCLFVIVLISFFNLTFADVFVFLQSRRIFEQFAEFNARLRNNEGWRATSFGRVRRPGDQFCIWTQPTPDGFLLPFFLALLVNYFINQSLFSYAHDLCLVRFRISLFWFSKILHRLRVFERIDWQGITLFINDTLVWNVHLDWLVHHHFLATVLKILENHVDLAALSSAGHIIIQGQLHLRLGDRIRILSVGEISHRLKPFKVFF